MEAELAAVEAKLADPLYRDRASQQRLEQERAWSKELRTRIQVQREQIAQVRPIAGGLPADAVGRWAPLPLFDKPIPEGEAELPLGAFEVTGEAPPDRAAIIKEIATELHKDTMGTDHLVALAMRWRGDAAILRVAGAALCTVGRGLGAGRRVPAKREWSSLTGPWLTMATEFPEEFDGLTGTQRLVLQALRVAAPPGGPFVRLSELASEVTRRNPHRPFHSARHIDLVDFLLAFIEHRREVAVKKLDRSLAHARLRAQDAEAVCVALALLEPVLAVMRAADEDAEAATGLMEFMRPEHRGALKTLPFPPSHRYEKGFTAGQAKHLLSVRKLASRTPEAAQRAWAELMTAVGHAEGLLSDRQAILDVVRQELRDTLVRFDAPRRTLLVYA